jgi:futalosine hydrolase
VQAGNVLSKFTLRMSKILLVAATRSELEPLLKELKPTLPLKEGVLSSYIYKNSRVDVMITGAGMVKTAFYLGSLTGKNYDLAINAGVCGSFNEQLKPGHLVNVIEDDFAELGAEDGEDFLSLDQISLGSISVMNETMFMNPVSEKLLKVKGITVNTVHGNEKSILRIQQRVHSDVESMEGAAFLLACNHNKWEALQIRSVSNKVERRNKKNWDLPLAISNLNDFLIQLIESL